MIPLIVALSVLALNVPFGYWRAGLRKRSLPWFLAIHLPVPAVVGLRFAADLDWTFIPVSVVSFFTGQWLGERWGHRRGRLPP
ncbi:MAG: hypothetical protein VXY00_01960 [Candidatus Latescibacterota bacterium]|nr:hypothetical protein [Candidatus Latescibacterota bacterium]MEC8645715.1 hypothetical protein [Candidatus Latescibacterota bacterium]